MASLLGKIIADFSTTLIAGTAVGATSATLLSATDGDGVALPAGRYFFTIDNGLSTKEHISCSLSGTALTSIKHVSLQGVETSGTTKAHRLGATIEITDFAHILQMNALLAGTTDFDATDPLKYGSAPTLTTGSNEFATVKYADDLAIAGSPDSTTSTKGIGRVSTAPVDSAIPIFVGDNDARVPTTDENNALVGNNTDIAVGTGNKFVTQTGLQHNAEKYAADAGSDDTYVVTLSPAPTSYTAGMVVYFKANTINTGAATLNVNGLGAKTIVKGVNTTLANGDIPAGQFCTVIYDGTNFVLQTPVATAVSIPDSTSDVSSGPSSSSTQTITHGLGRTPKKIRLSGIGLAEGSVSSTYYSSSFGTYNSTGNRCVYIDTTTPSAGGAPATSTVFAVYLAETSAIYASGVVGNITATTFDIVWTNTGGSAANCKFIWETE